MKKIQNTRILDCTFRDGGYYNLWDFSTELTNEYLSSIVKTGVDVVEIGFRSLPDQSFHGPYFYSTDDFLLSLDLPTNLKYAVMINASDYLEEESNLNTLLGILFQPCINSPVDLVRIAVNFHNYQTCQNLLKLLKDLGYEIGLNLMQSQGKSYDDYASACYEIEKWGCVDVLYFADSLGSMNPDEVEFISNAFRSNWSGSLGIHTHNNKGLALSNCFAGLNNGVTWCDSTILGMGRGAGNVSTESLLLELNNYGFDKFDASFLKDCLGSFRKLLDEYKWGPNEYYHFAADKGIHPTYVQSLLSDKRYKDSDLFGVLQNVSQSNASSFSPESLKIASIKDFVGSSKGTWDASHWLDGREVLLIGSGTSAKNHLKGIKSYIEKYKPFVVTLNVNRWIPRELVNGVVVGHHQRAMLDAGYYASMNCPIIMPVGSLWKKLNISDEGLDLFDYGMEVIENNFAFHPLGCTVPSPLALCYALGVLTQAGAKKISLVGFDGYGSDDPRQEEVIKAFLKYKEHPKALPLEALTPTSYPILKGSIYSPRVPMNDFLVVIPARYASSRFPGKPLADLCGKSLLKHVWEKCTLAVGADNVIVATDDQRIVDHCSEERMEVLLTSQSCLTGTDRLAEVAQKIKKKHYINVQGDEPLIDPNDIQKILSQSLADPGVIFNGMCDITDRDDFVSYNVPKVVCSENNDLLYMSRAPIPSNKSGDFIKAKRQVCIYSFPRESLLKFANCSDKTPNESIEDIEIIRFLELGLRVRMIDLSENPVAVDTEEDLLRAQKIISGSKDEL
jgi:4-hydroxy 2-oxovalerate aldolase